LKARFSYGKHVSIKPLKDKSSAFLFWQTKTDPERLEAIEILRQQFIHFNYPHAEPKLQRVCTVVKQK
jgi:hypothetical protein